MSTVGAAQKYVISTYAGGAPSPVSALASDLYIGFGSGVAADAAGNVYFASATLHMVFRLDTGGRLTRVAGTSRPGYGGDGGPATSARLGLGFLSGIAVDGSGNLFIADTGNHSVRRVSPNGTITTVAGTGRGGFSGDGGPAANAQLAGPTGIAVDRAGNLFVSDYGNFRIRKVSRNGIISTVAGHGAPGLSGDDGPATSAQLYGQVGVAVDAAGNLFLAGNVTGRIRKVSYAGIITTVMTGDSSGMGSLGGSTFRFQDWPWGVAVDAAGNLFLSDYTSGRVRKVSSDGTLTTVAGGGAAGPGDGGPATSAQLGLATGIAFDPAGNLIIAAGGVIRKVSPGGTITTVAGTRSNACCPSGDGGPATGAILTPASLALDRSGNLFIADSLNHRIRRVSPDRIIATVAGNGTRGASGDGGPATRAQLDWPSGIAVDGAGNLFTSELFGHRVRKVSPEGIITTIAGDGTEGFSGDSGPATRAQLHWPSALAVDSAGNLFISDSGNNRVRKVSPDGIIATVAADLGASGMAVDASGNLFLASIYEDEESALGRILKVATNGTITTLADTEMLMGLPSGLAVDDRGSLWISAAGRVLKMSLADGTITTVAGTGEPGFSGDGGPAASATLIRPTGLAVDAAGNVFIADTGNNAVRALRSTDRSVFVGSVVDAASHRPDPIAPGKLVVIYGAGLGPSQLIRASAPSSTELAGTVVSFNGIAAPALYTSAAQVAVVVPSSITGSEAQVTVRYNGEVSAPFPIPVAASAPSLFTLNQAGWGQAAAIHAADGTANTAANPVKPGEFISVFSTGEGLTAGVPPQPILPLTVTIGGIRAAVESVAGDSAGLMQVKVRVPDGVEPGGYVPLVLQVGDVSTTTDAVWIAVSGGTGSANQ